VVCCCAAAEAEAVWWLKSDEKRCWQLQLANSRKFDCSLQLAADSFYIIFAHWHCEFF